MSPQFSTRIIVNADTGLSAIRKGYWAGGFDGFTDKSGIQGLNFETETSIDPTATLSLARSSLCGINSLSHGYWGGGFTGVFVERDTIDGIVFETEAANNPAATIADGAIYSMGGVSSSAEGKGYFGGGVTNSFVYRDWISGLIFATEAAIDPAAVLADSRGHAAGVSSSTKGYWAGGWDDVIKSEIDAMLFSTEAAENPSAVLATARMDAGGVQSSTRGYFAGGSNKPSAPTYYNVYDGIRFDTEAAINPSLVLSAGKRLFDAAISSNLKGYFGGGFNPSYLNVIDGMIFSSETAENPSATLPDGNTSFFSGVQPWPQ